MINLEVEFTDGECTVKPAENRAVLPAEVRPVHYDVSLKPDFETFKFEGEVSIGLNVLKEVSQILLNTADIVFHEATLSQGGSDVNIAGKDITVEEKDEIATIPVNVKAGNATLKISFQGEMNDKLKGFYRSRYTDNEGGEHLIGTTQFEAVDARRAFPCWDEPAAKATFSLTLTVPQDKLALSNMPEVENTSVDGGLKKIVFDKSPIMSTYLLAWVIGDFEHVETHTKNGTLVRVFTPVGKRNQAGFALEVAKKCLEFYEEYFEIPFPLPKSDMIAIPDFSAGAMENWGLITYREVAILCDPEASSAQQKEYVALVVAHELAHQWFGNLVTMEWWSQLWLNEGFACFIEYLAVDHLFPEWQMWNEFVSTETNSALGLDGLKNSHPIEVEIDHPSKIDEIFDRISYSKGACVIKMIQSYLGAETFRKALVKYLNHYKYSNAITTDLWRFLSEESGKDVAKIMDFWTKEQGYPVVSIQDEGKDEITLTQNRFLSSGAPTADEDSVVWSVPIIIQTGGSDEPISVLLDERQKSFSLPAGASFYKLNLNASGVFRVKYDKQGLENLSEAIKNKQISAIDRINVLSDSLAMARAGIGSTVDTMTLLKAYANEDDLSVFTTVSGALGAVKKLASHGDYLDDFNAFGTGLFEKLANELGWEERESDDHRTKQLRAVAIASMAGFNDPATVQEALKRFAVYKDTKSGIPNDLRPAVYKTVARHGTPEDYQSLKANYESSSEPRDRIRCLSSLGAVNSTELLKDVLVYGMSEKVRRQDTIYGICPVAENPLGRDMAWEWLKENWGTLRELFPGLGFLPRFIKMSETFMTEEKAQEVEAFFKTCDTTSAERGLQQSLETIRVNAAWFQRDGEAVKDWLKENNVSKL